MTSPDDYEVGQEVEIVQRYYMARSSGHFAGQRKYEVAKVMQVADGYAELSTGERINLATGKLEGTKTT